MRRGGAGRLGGGVLWGRVPWKEKDEALGMWRAAPALVA